MSQGTPRQAGSKKPGHQLELTSGGAMLKPLLALLAFQALVGGAALIRFDALSQAERVQFAAEGGPIEELTAVLFAVGALLGVIRVVYSGPRVLLNWLWPTAAMMALFDETSFAERHLGWTMPKLYGVKLDAFHDVIDVVYHFLHDHFLKQDLLLGVGLLAVCFVTLSASQRVRLMKLLRSSAPLRFALLGAAWLIPSTAIDLWLIENNDWTIFIEELCECEAAIALLVANLVIMA